MRHLLLPAIVFLLVCSSSMIRGAGAAYTMHLLNTRVYNASATMPADARNVGSGPTWVAASDFETPNGATCTDLVLDIALQRTGPAAASATMLLPYPTTFAGSSVSAAGGVAIWIWVNTSIGAPNQPNTGFTPMTAFARANVSSATILAATIPALPLDLAALIVSGNPAYIPLRGSVRVPMPLLGVALPRAYYWIGVSVLLPPTAPTNASVRCMAAAPAVVPADRYGQPYEMVDAFGTAMPSLPSLRQWTSATFAEPYLMSAPLYSSGTGELALALYANCSGPGILASDPRILPQGLPLLYMAPADLPPTPTPIPPPIPTPTPTPLPVPKPIPTPTPIPSPIPPSTLTIVPTPTPAIPPMATPTAQVTESTPSLANITTPSAPIEGGNGGDNLMIRWIIGIIVIVVLCIGTILLLLYILLWKRQQQRLSLDSRSVLAYSAANNAMTATSGSPRNIPLQPVTSSVYESVIAVTARELANNHEQHTLRAVSLESSNEDEAGAVASPSSSTQLPRVSARM